MTVADESTQVAQEGVRKVQLETIKVHPGLQPRDAALLHARDSVRQEAQSEGHVQSMAALLKADAAQELTPVRLAEVEGVLYVVDGHHRLKAYNRAKREAIPAHVEAMTLAEASHASKLANVQGTKLEMHMIQKRNALWHHLAQVTHRGLLPLPQGNSQRKLAGQFGVALDTVQRMLKRLPEVEPGRWPSEQRDAITGWPHWRYVSATARNGMWQQMDVDQRMAWKAKKYRAKLAKLWEQFEPEAVEMAHAQLVAEAEEAAEERRVRKLEVAFWGTEGVIGEDDF